MKATPRRLMIAQQVSRFVSALYLIAIGWLIILGAVHHDAYYVSSAAVMLLLLHGAALHDIKRRPVINIGAVTMKPMGTQTDPLDDLLSKHFPTGGPR